MTKTKQNAIEMLNKVIDQSIIKGDWETFKRLTKLHKNLVIDELNHNLSTLR